MSDGGGWAALVLLGVLAFGIHKCSQEPSEDVAAPAFSGSYTQSEPTAEAIDRADDAAADAVAGTTYADQGQPYGCTQDCSGHDAGYSWAQDNDVTEPDECGGNSLSFEEGCRSYAEAYQEAREEALEQEE